MPRLTERAKQALAEDRRAQILEAAAAVFSGQGYHGATIRQIAERAGLADGTIYLYFASKRDLLLATWEHVALSSLFPILDRAPATGNDQEFVATLLADRFELFRRHAPFLRLVLHQADVDPVLRRALQARIETVKALVGDHLRQRIAEGTFRRISVPIALRAIAGMMLGVALIDAYDPEPLLRRYSAEAVAREVADLILRGLVAGAARHPHAPLRAPGAPKGLPSPRTKEQRRHGT